MYAHGQGVPQDYQQTAILMRKAAENMYYPRNFISALPIFMVKACLRIIVRQFTGLIKVYQAAMRRAIPLNVLYDKAHPADRVYSQTWYRKQRNA